MENFDVVQKTLEKKLLSETIRAFSITNEELASKGKSSHDGYEQCVLACKVKLNIPILVYYHDYVTYFYPLVYLALKFAVFLSDNLPINAVFLSENLPNKQVVHQMGSFDYRKIQL